MLESNTKRIAFLGIFSALMFVLLTVETFIFYGMWQFTSAILTLPLAIALSLFWGRNSMFIGGLMFGCCSFILAICISYVYFMNPLVSILPRIFIGVVAFFVYSLVKFLLKRMKNQMVVESISCIFAAIFGVFTNTVLTTFMLWLFYPKAVTAVLSIILSVNFVLEVVGAVILVPIYTIVLKRMSK